MTLDEESLTQIAIGIRRRRKEFVEKTLLRLAEADHRGVVHRIEIERVAVERQQ